MTSVLHVPESQYDSRMWWCTVECAEPERHIRFHAGYLTNLSILTNTEHSNGHCPLTPSARYEIIRPQGLAFLNISVNTQ